MVANDGEAGVEAALKNKPAIPFRIPSGIHLVRVDAATGLPAQPGDKNVIFEAFKPGTAPPENNAIASAGYEGGGVTPEADGAVRRGGLY